MSFKNLLATIFSLLCITGTASSANLQLNQRLMRRGLCNISTSVLSAPIPPSQDDWYLKPPSGFEITAPGTILRIRKAPGSLTGTIANSSAAYNILYRTTDSRYEPTWTVTTLFLPSLPTSQYGEYLLSYRIPYDNADVEGSPSYGMYTPGWAPTDISAALGSGWHVFTGDYEGPLASFTAGVMSGHAVLDGVRAILSGGCAGTFGLHPEVKYALWGYSGGALASEFATELQKSYAPEINLVGAVLGGLTPNATSTRETVEGTLYAGLIALWLLGVTSQFPLVREYIVSKLKKTGPFNASTFLSPETNVNAVELFEFQNISNYFIGGFADLDNSLVQAVVASDDTLVNKYCDLSARIWYQRNTDGTHGSEAQADDYIAFNFLESVFAGKYSLEGCKIETVTNPVP